MLRLCVLDRLLGLKSGSGTSQIVGYLASYIANVVDSSII
jgi:tryptophan 2,3-dioxygenase